MSSSTPSSIIMKNVLFVVLFLLPIVGGSLDKRSLLKTIESEDGDVIECIDFFDQPAFSDPIIKNHAIQIIAEQNVEEEYKMTNSSGLPPIKQTWQKSGSCPEGTIPILRMEEKDTVLNSSIGGNPGAHVEMAIAYDNDGPFEGARGEVAVWKPYVESTEYSTSIVACSSGGFPGSVTDVLAAGWAVNPAFFGDKSPRSVIAMTKDNSMILWCYNIKCPGFIQTNPNFVLGGILDSSVYGDPNYLRRLKVSIYKDENHQVWKVSFNYEDIGYIPIAYFTDFVQCDTALWGGLVYNSEVFPTRTEMGNGHFSREGVSKTGLISNALVKIKGSFVAHEYISGLQMTRPSRYDIQAFVSGIPESSPGNIYLFGGPGAQSASSRCSKYLSPGNLWMLVLLLV